MKEIEGTAVLTEDEKRTALEGARIIAEFCETNTGCAGCPFYLGYEIQKDGGTACELKNFLPCGWTIPETWQEGGDPFMTDMAARLKAINEKVMNSPENRIKAQEGADE